MASPVQGNMNEMGLRLEFTKNLNHVTNKIHATSNIDEIMLDVSKDICTLFNADRLTIYVVGEDRASLISKVKTGLNSFKDLKLPIAEQSIAGYVIMELSEVSYLDILVPRKVAFIIDIAVMKRYQGKGIGYALFQQSIAWAKAKGSDSLDLMVWDFNQNAIAFYERQGMKSMNRTMSLELQ